MHCWVLQNYTFLEKKPFSKSRAQILAHICMSNSEGIIDIVKKEPNILFELATISIFALIQYSIQSLAKHSTGLQKHSGDKCCISWDVRRVCGSHSTQRASVGTNHGQDTCVTSVGAEPKATSAAPVCLTVTFSPLLCQGLPPPSHCYPV